MTPPAEEFETEPAVERALDEVRRVGEELPDRAVCILYDRAEAGAAGLVRLAADDVAPRSARFAALRILRIVGRIRPDDAAALASLLDDGDTSIPGAVGNLLPHLDPFPSQQVLNRLGPEHSHAAHTAAAWALGAQRPSSAAIVEALVAALRREAATPPDRRFEEVDLGSPIGKPEISRRVRRDVTERCRAALIHTLSRSSPASAEVVATIAAQATDESQVVQHAATEGLLRCGCAGVDALAAIATGVDAPSIRFGAILALSKTDGASDHAEEALARCVTRTGPGEWELAVQAIVGIGRHGVETEAGSDALQRAFSSDDARLRAAAAEATGADSRFAESVFAATEDADARVVAAATGSLSVADARVLVRLSELAESPEPTIRAAAAATFGRIGSGMLKRDLAAR